MPSLSKVFSRSREAKEKEACVEQAESIDHKHPSPPPSYTEHDASDYTDGPADFTAGFANLKIDSSESGVVPRAQECVAHLKLLECFYRLRQRIGSADSLFNISDSLHDQNDEQRTSGRDDLNKIRAAVAEKRWQVYVSRAVSRFEQWRNAVQKHYDWLTITEASRDKNTGGKIAMMVRSTSNTAAVSLDRHNLPPVDVLMVWHAYMLNPRAYLEDSIREGRMLLWHCPMPWQAVVEVINNESFEYNPPLAAQETFEKETGLEWHNTQDASDVSILCPHCSAPSKVPWTTCGKMLDIPKGSYGPRELETVQHQLSSGRGFADKHFLLTCRSCDQTADHDAMCAGKFCRDVQQTVESDVVLPGCVLGMTGVPGSVGMTLDKTSSEAMLFPAQLMRAGLGLKMAYSRKPTDMHMARIREDLEIGLADKQLVKTARDSLSHRLLRNERIAVRRMMSRYWENSSSFALDLVGAVIRQSSFIEKMHGIDWLHSPALNTTMARLIIKYTRFVSLMKNETQMAVPTLDVDLAWHTHQLNPSSYLQYTVAETRSFVDHDDKVAETKLNDSFAWTSKTYQKLYGEPYSECTCWYCEAIRESHTSAASRLFHKGNASRAADSLHSVSSDPRKSVHISNHNAVHPTGDAGQYDVAAKAQADDLEKYYAKACVRAQKKGRSPPKRNDYYYSDAWGYPIYMPVFALGMYGYTPMMYTANPACMAMIAGSFGQCCSGTCGGAVGVGGSCGGGGTCGSAGGCGGGMGGMAGGCGGAGGGCGGGGGGCGGGGGGC